MGVGILCHSPAGAVTSNETVVDATNNTEVAISADFVDVQGSTSPSMTEPSDLSLINTSETAAFDGYDPCRDVGPAPELTKHYPMCCSWFGQLRPLSCTEVDYRVPFQDYDAFERRCRVVSKRHWRKRKPICCARMFPVCISYLFVINPQFRDLVSYSILMGIFLYSRALVLDVGSPARNRGLVKTERYLKKSNWGN